MREINTELLIMGSGLAGVSAAITAQKQGAKVTLVEKRPFQGGGVSNTPMMTMAVKEDPKYRDKAFTVHMNYTNWNANPAVVRTWIDNTARIPGFVKDLKIDFLHVVETPYEEIGERRGYLGGFPNGFNIGDYYLLKPIGRGHGAAVIIKKACDQFTQNGGEFIKNCAIKSLIKDGDKITGAVGEMKDGEKIQYNAKAIIIASGGYSNNAEMIKKYTGFTFTDINCSGDGNVVFNTFYNAAMLGEGQQAVWDIGGAKGSMGINGHNLVPGPGIIGCSPWIIFNEFRTVQEQPYLWVNQFGERFISEEMSNDHMAMCTAISNQPTKRSYIIFDEDTKLYMENEGLDYIYHIFPAEKLHNLTSQFEKSINVDGNKHVFMSDTVEELAKQTGIDAACLKATIARYNTYCDKGHDDEFSKQPKFLRPVRKPKFYALRCFAGGYQGLGGIKINGKCEVLSENLRPIKGLYAAGDCCSGELYGDPPTGGIGISTACFAQGFASADFACEYINGTQARKG
jgi:fumarate reductase flavoprotein subunit